MTDMEIDHLAVWVRNLEKMKEFYTKYFNMSCSKKYVNNRKKFSSYFLSFESGARLEIMHRPGTLANASDRGGIHGFTHMAISVGSKEKVDKLTEIFRQDGNIISGEPRTTSDGNYESVILDPEGNNIEITV